MKHNFLKMALAGFLGMVLVMPALILAPAAYAQESDDDGGGIPFDGTGGSTETSVDVDQFFQTDPNNDDVEGAANTFATDSGLPTGDLTGSVAGIIKIAIGFLGVIAVLIILAGGFKWMTAGGNEDKVGDARKLLIAGLIGLVIILAAYAIATFVIQAIVTSVQ